ncbi:hypothetical protein C7U92_20395 [Bradyrhizobium sp. WBOS7]|uniref:Methyltransferase type 11 domain-containing protein n=1 Tax=Bradyrhizobium betae TaxID=244734 RepID=A0AAE9N5W5_9BRAD|nr:MULTISPECIES: class I SAM-dependent methyltransferase [Bradyrhizobium]MDD1572971.1 hypothetical protein [Bradyrhizobium sp. WBOS1]UUO33168.1 hypothetical protein DCK84_00290 [Bradyrhizobium sp. WBOS01]MDD1529422.1 hypothetical protein [Bradyrhizobium sp. WBOS2]MDD1579056.1 hypothetical protein [Bradyrhizobium sp. WBOS7]MDD1601863.1 hypothetical protein [Bradyrhizobium sp. WBOS16]
MHLEKINRAARLDAKEEFCLYFDAALEQPTPYSAKSSYLKDAQARMDRTVELIRPYIAGSRILDIGASPFYLLYKAKLLGARQCTGVYFANDSHPLKDFSAVHSAYGPIELSHVDIERCPLPFEDNSFDVVTACEVLEHLEYFPARLGAEIRRVLRPGGTLCITVPNACRVANIAKLILQKNIYMPYRADPTGRHKHEFTIRELEAFVEFLGIAVAQSGFLSIPTSNRKVLRMFYRVVGALPLIRNYSPVIYVVGKQEIPKSRAPLNDFPKILYSDALSIED